MRRMHFCNWFLWAEYNGCSVSKTFFFCTDEAWFHLSVSALKVTDVRSVLIHNRLFKCPFTIRRWVCDVPLLLHEHQDPF
jgi:hypothetical protein